MSSAKNINDFNPNAAGNKNLNIFGLPFTPEQAKIVLLPVPWDVTVSYNDGTANAPIAIFDASFQVDLFDAFAGNFWKPGIAMLTEYKEISQKNQALRKKANLVIEHIINGESINKSKEQHSYLKLLNKECEIHKNAIKVKSLELLTENKLVGIVGGDHSCPLGLIEALATKYEHFGILQIDAHADLRKAYEGFKYSHASIMYNAMKNPQISKLVQVGIRDFCEEEMNRIHQSKNRISTFFDRDLKNKIRKS